MAKQVVPEEGRRRRRPTRTGTVLSERLIVETALRMLREHGSAGLSARRLGAALGADPSTLYRYFTGMDELTRAIGEELIGRALDGWPPAGTGGPTCASWGCVSTARIWRIRRRRC